MRRVLLGTGMRCVWEVTMDEAAAAEGGAGLLGRTPNSIVRCLFAFASS